MTAYQGLTIGIPREIMPGERRVAAIPETVREWVSNGARVLVETGAGQGVFFPDGAYQEAGAHVTPDPRSLFSQSQLILKVKEPLFNDALDEHEADWIPVGSTLVCFLHPANPLNHAVVRRLAERGVVSYSLDSIPRIPRAQHMDALTSMSTVAGYKAMLHAADRLARFVPMIPTDAGILEPAQVLVVGTGVAGLQSLAVAKRLGARVRFLDIRPEANEQARSLGATQVSFDLPEGAGVGPGGYARRLSEEQYARERAALAPVVAECDVVILSALVYRQRAPILVDEPMVQGMKQGSVIVDVAVDQGGNCSVTRAGEECWVRDVLVSGLMNIPGYLAIDATRMFAHNMFQYVRHLVVEGRLDPETDDEILREALVTKDGAVVHAGTLQAMQETGG